MSEPRSAAPCSLASDPARGEGKQPMGSPSISAPPAACSGSSIRPRTGKSKRAGSAIFSRLRPGPAPGGETSPTSPSSCAPLWRARAGKSGNGSLPSRSATPAASWRPPWAGASAHQCLAARALHTALEPHLPAGRNGPLLAELDRRDPDACRCRPLRPDPSRADPCHDRPRRSGLRLDAPKSSSKQRGQTLYATHPLRRRPVPARRPDRTA